MDVMTIDSLDGLRSTKRRGLAGAASDYDVLANQQLVMADFEDLAETGAIPQSVIDSVRSRFERVNAQFEALVSAVEGYQPDAGVTPEVLERAAQQSPSAWSEHMRAAADLYSDVRAIVGRESALSKLRSAAAFSVGAALGVLLMRRLT